VYGTFNKKGKSIRTEANELHGEVVFASHSKRHGHYILSYVQKESNNSLSGGEKTF
jgi:hypothetical protein